MDLKKEKRELIIQAAIKIFAKEGFHAAKISSIAQTAGIGKGTIYEYFDSKSQLYEEMIKYTIEIYMQNISSIFEDTKSTRERLKKFVELAFNIAKEHMDICKIHNHGTEVVGEKSINIMLTTQKRVMEMVEGVIQQGIENGELKPIDTRIAALAFLGSVHHMTVHYLFIYKRDIMQEEIDSYVDIYINGLKK